MDQGSDQCKMINGQLALEVEAKNPSSIRMNQKEEGKGPLGFEFWLLGLFRA
jgi:hypothetical protein